MWSLNSVEMNMQDGKFSMSMNSANHRMLDMMRESNLIQAGNDATKADWDLARKETKDWDERSIDDKIAIVNKIADQRKANMLTA